MYLSNKFFKIEILLKVCLQITKNKIELISKKFNLCNKIYYLKKNWKRGRTKNDYYVKIFLKLNF
jgi:hypothetical protein